MPRLLCSCVILLVVSDAVAAPPRITGVKPVPRSILNLERDFIAPIDTDDAVIKKGAVVDVVLDPTYRYQNGAVSGRHVAGAYGKGDVDAFKRHATER